MSYAETYRRIYSLEPEYGSVNHGSGIVPRLLGHYSSVLDVGCGDGAFLRMMDCPGVGVDIAGTGPNVINCDATQGLPFADGEFDLVTSFDFLEHIREDDLDFLISEMGRVGNRMIHRIATHESEQHGMILHETVKPQGWWISKIRDVTGLPFARTKDPTMIGFGDIPL